MECPGCGYVVVANTDWIAPPDPDSGTELDVLMEFESLPDGRWVGTQIVNEQTRDDGDVVAEHLLVVHECAYPPGDESSGDREPRPVPPAPRMLGVERDVKSD